MLKKTILAPLSLLIAALLPASSVFAQQTVVGATPGEFNASGGSANYSIPISIESGRGGMQPELSLNYSSDGGDGILGKGWSLGGLSAIRRCPRTIVHDGQVGSINFDANDRYCLDGQRLIPLNGGDGGLGVEYRTEVDGYAQILSVGGSAYNPSHFIVKTKAGQVITYGGNSNASHNFAQGTITWSVREINDTTGNNAINFSYFIDQNTQYLDRIDYQGGAVDLSFSPRADIISGYLVGNYYQQSYRLNEIATYSNGESIKNYKLGYQDDSNYSQSNLVDIEVCHLALSCLRKNIFEYNSAALSFAAAQPSGSLHNGSGNTQFEKISGDFNGDGKSDFGLIHFGSNHGWVARTALSNGDGSFSSHSSTPRNGSGSDRFEKISGDFNGDGRTDIGLVHFSNSYGWVSYIALSRGDGTFEASISTNMRNGSGSDRYEHITGDFNGDGRTDLGLVHFSNGYGWSTHIALSQGDGTFDASISSSMRNGSGSDQYDNITGDFNGDGLTDLGLVHFSNSYGWSAHISVSRGDGTFAPSVTTSMRDGSGTDHQKKITGDFNGDGVTDLGLVHFSNSYGWNVHIALGEGDGTFTASVSSSMRNGSGSDAFDRFETDYNGDGLTDLGLVHFSNDYGWSAKVSLSRGDGTFEPANEYWGLHSGNISDDQDKFEGDFDGDGSIDLALVHWSSSYGWAVNTSLNSAQATQLHRITDSNTNVTELSYKPLTDNSVYTKCPTPGFCAPPETSYPVQNLQYARYVVSEVETTDGIGGTTMVQYHYEGLKTHMQGRGSYGFSKVTETYPDTLKQLVTEYDQSTFPFAGNVKKVTESYNGNTVNESSNTFVALESYPGVQQLNPGQATQTSYELGGSAQPVTTITTTYENIDIYGNVGRVRTETTGGGQTFTKIVESNYGTSNSDRRLGRLSDTTVTHQSPYSANDEIRRTSFTYDATTGLLLTENILNASGIPLTTTTYTYDAYGQKIEERLSAAGEQDRLTTTTYDATGRPTQTCNALNQCETYSYTAEGWLQTTTGPNGISTTLVYDTWGRQIAENRADGTSTTVSREFVSGGNCGVLANFAYTCSITQSSGTQPIIVQYDTFGREVRKITQGFDERLTYTDTEYNHLAQVARISRDYYFGDQLYWAVSEYDSLERVTRMTEPGPHGSRNEITYEYNGLTTTVRSGPEARAKTTINNAIGQKIRVEEEENTYTEYTYRSDGNLLTTQVNDDIDTTITLHYDEFGRKIGMDDPDMGSWQYTYTPFGELETQTDAKSQVTTMAYDVLGRMVSRTEPEGTSTWTYGGNTAPQGSIGKLLQESGNGLTKDYSYDNLGRPVSTTTTIAGEGSFTTETQYDSLGRVQRVTYPGSQNFYTENIYNANGFLESVRGLRSQAEAHDYSALQPLIQEAVDLADDYLVRANQLQTIGAYYQSQIAYYQSLTGSGTVDSALQAQLSQHQSTLNTTVAEGQSTGVDKKLAQFIPIMMGDIMVPIVHFQHQQTLPPELLSHINNTIIELQTVTGLLTTQSQSYASIAEQLVVLAEQTLAAADHNFEFVDTLDNSATAYNDLITESSTSHITYWRAVDVDASGRISAEVYGNGIVNDYAYNQATGQLQSIHSSLLVVDAIRHLEYQYDAYQNVTLRDDLVNDIRETFNYDSLDRLTSTQVTSSLYQGTDFNNTQSLTYNGLGNITDKSDVGGYSYGTRPHAVTQAGSNSYSYDANGNMTSGDGRTIQWSSFNKPTQIIRNGRSATFSYGPDRARYKKVNHKGDTTLYLGLYERTTRSNSNVEQKHYIYAAGQLVAEHILSTSEGTQTRYLHKDALGSIDMVTDAYANVVDRRSFDAWGKLRNMPWQSQAGLDDPFYLTQLPFTNKGYTGHEHVQEVELIHMNGRMYDATLARFISADPHIQAGSMSQSYNRYSYVMNNPLKYTDPSGYFFKDLHKKSLIYNTKYQWYKKVANESTRLFIRINKQQVRTVPALGNVNDYIATHQWAQVLGGIVASYYGGAAGAAGWASFVTYTQGGSVEDIRQAGEIAFGTAVVSSYIGAQDWSTFGKAIAHGVVGGSVSVLQGGKFGQGFASSFFTKLASPGIARASDRAPIAGVMVAALVGGTASKLGGGKFANGAATAAIQYIFNELLSTQNGRAITSELTDAQRKALVKSINAEMDLIDTAINDIAETGEVDFAQTFFDGFEGDTSSLATARLGTLKKQLWAVRHNLTVDSVGSGLIRAPQEAVTSTFLGKGRAWYSLRSYARGKLNSGPTKAHTSCHGVTGCKFYAY